MKKIILFMLLLLNLHVTIDIDKGSLNFECGKIMAQNWLEETLPDVVVTASQYTTCSMCYMTVEKKNLQMHLDLDCPKRTVECGFCHKSYVYCDGHTCNVEGYCLVCHKSIDECTCEGAVCTGNERPGQGKETDPDNGEVPIGSGWVDNNRTNWISSIYSPNNGETLIPNYIIPTEWLGQFPNISSCFFCCMEYIWNIQHSTPDFRNNIHINGTGQYTDCLRNLYEFDYKYLFQIQNGFHGVSPLCVNDLLSYEGFQYVEIGNNEISNYLDSQYLIILCYSFNVDGNQTAGHAVLVIGYDNNNNFIVVDPATGEIKKMNNSCDVISVRAISPYTYNSRMLNNFDYE